jgi:glycosyltransferase involved in cell wall biosynthesis
VFLVGYVKHEDVNKWMNAADIFVLPSIQESFGIVQLEALATGTPIVSTRTDGSLELIKEGKVGLLCNVANAEDLASQIDTAFKKSWRSEEMIDYSKEFTWEDISERILKLYERCYV